MTAWYYFSNSKARLQPEGSAISVMSYKTPFSDREHFVFIVAKNYFETALIAMGRGKEDA